MNYHPFLLITYYYFIVDYNNKKLNLRFIQKS